MNSLEEARYRLILAEGYLKRAEGFFTEGAWHDCVRDAQAAVENAGKALIAPFAPLERGHEPVRQIKALLDHGAFPKELRSLIEQSIPVLGSLGRKEHIWATYGDEDTHTPPWELFDEADAQRALQAARQAVEVARRVVGHNLSP